MVRTAFTTRVCSSVEFCFDAAGTEDCRASSEKAEDFFFKRQSVGRDEKKNNKKFRDQSLLFIVRRCTFLLTCSTTFVFVC